MIHNALTGGVTAKCGKDRRGGRTFPFCQWFCTLSLVAACFAVLAPAARAQEQQKSKLPLVGKLGSNANHEAFSGRIQSVDLSEKILNVNAMQGQETEIFPLRKDTRIQGVNGKKLKLQALTPGTSVLIYYSDRNGGREIRNIIVLEGAKDHGKSSTVPPSS